eukprot:3316159-Karenia_brevis.AAC.1
MVQFADADYKTITFRLERSAPLSNLFQASCTHFGSFTNTETFWHPIHMQLSGEATAASLELNEFDTITMFSA